jgi:segregation and condensation protein B
VEDVELKAVIESLIFVSESPLSLDRIKEVLGEVSKKDLQRYLSELIEDYERTQRSFILVEVAEGFQFRTRPQYAEWIKKLKKTKPLALSQPALETLAIVAYQQPIVRADVEKIRGVDSGGVLRTLLERKLIKILGKKDIPGRPLVYGTSKQFLEVFGLKDLSSLPTLKDVEGLGPPHTEELLPLSWKGGEGQELAGRKETGLLSEKEAVMDESPSKGAKDSF